LKAVARAGELRVGLIGYGLAGAHFHAPLIATTPGLRLVAIVTSDPERSARAQREHDGAQVLHATDELWRRADMIDVVVVATPNRSHAALAREALDAGLPVVVDKPLATSAADARALVADAARRGLMLTVFQNRRWDGDFMTLRRLLSGAELGRVLRFETRFERWRPEPRAGWRESGDPHDAGGLLFDLGSHLIDQALLLFGPVERVYAELNRRREGVHVDDDTFVALTHESGVHSHLWMSAVAAHAGPRFRVLGSRAAYVKRGMDVQEAALRSGRRPGTPDWGLDPESGHGLLVVGDEVRAVPTERGAWPRFYEGVVAAVRDGSPPPVDPNDAVAVLDVIESARRSAEPDGLPE
jgi:scyllo-inositol 2-dehydrogenase (NADP+)